MKKEIMKVNMKKKNKADKSVESSDDSATNAVEPAVDPAVEPVVEPVVGAATCTMQVTGYLESSCTFGGTQYSYTTGPDSCYQGSQGNWAKYECYACSSGQCIWVYTSTAQADCQSQTTQSNFIEYKLNTCTKNSAVTGYYSKVNFDYNACCGSANSGVVEIIPAN